MYMNLEMTSVRNQTGGAGVPGEYDYCWWLAEAVSLVKQQSCIFCASLVDLTTISCCTKCFPVMWVSYIPSTETNRDHCDRQSLAMRSDRKTETKCRVFDGFSFLHYFCSRIQSASSSAGHRVSIMLHENGEQQY